MLRVEASENRVTIRGTGLQFLRAKTTISAFAGEGEVLTVGKNSFSAPLSAYLQAKPGLGDGIVEDVPSASLIMGRLAELDLHENARSRVREIIEKGKTLTGFPRWDAILDPHQGIASNAMSVPGLSGLCLFDEQGTGKTVSLLAAFDIMKNNGEVECAVVIAPKTLQENWKKEALRFLPSPATISIIDGNKEVRYRELQKKADLYIVTYETLGFDLPHFISLAKTRKVFLVADESFFVKNPDSRRSKTAREFRRHCVRAVVLCGSPAPNTPMDLVNQFDIADNGYTFGETVIPEDGEARKETIGNLIESRGVYLRRTKELVLPDLPKKVFHIVPVRMEPKQALLYSTTKKELVLFLRTLDNRTFRRSLTTYFQKRAALLQICVSPSLIDPLVTDVPGKYLALDRLLSTEIQGKNNKVVVWSVYTKTVDDLIDRYRMYNPVRVDGTVTGTSLRQEMINRFQNDPQTKLFVGNPMAAGAGVTLHSAHIAVYLSFSNQAAHYMQSLDRVHRRGQTASSVEYFFLVCQGTIEQNELERLVSKQKNQSDLFGDFSGESPSLESALHEVGET